MEIYGLSICTCGSLKMKEPQVIENLSQKMEVRYMTNNQTLMGSANGNDDTTASPQFVAGSVASDRIVWKLRLWNGNNTLRYSNVDGKILHFLIGDFPAHLQPRWTTRGYPRESGFAERRVSTESWLTLELDHRDNQELS